MQHCGNPGHNAELHTLTRSCKEKSPRANLRLHRLPLLLLAITAGRRTGLHNLQGNLGGCALVEATHGHPILLALVTNDVEAIFTGDLKKAMVLAKEQKVHQSHGSGWSCLIWLNGWQPQT